jgi:hypothetical protein
MGIILQLFWSNGIQQDSKKTGNFREGSIPPNQDVPPDIGYVLQLQQQQHLHSSQVQTLPVQPGQQFSSQHPHWCSDSFAVSSFAATAVCAFGQHDDPPPQPAVTKTMVNDKRTITVAPSTILWFFLMQISPAYGWTRNIVHCITCVEVSQYSVPVIT